MPVARVRVSARFLLLLLLVALYPAQSDSAEPAIVAGLHYAGYSFDPEERYGKTESVDHNEFGLLVGIQTTRGGASIMIGAEATTSDDSPLSDNRISLILEGGVALHRFARLGVRLTSGFWIYDYDDRFRNESYTYRFVDTGRAAYNTLGLHAYLVPPLGKESRAIDLLIDLGVQLSLFETRTVRVAGERWQDHSTEVESVRPMKLTRPTAVISMGLSLAFR